MAKKGNTEPPRDDPRENNWEIIDEKEPAIKVDPDELKIAKEPALILPDELKTALEIYPRETQEIIIQAWKNFPESLRCENPVWICNINSDNYITFIFRDGRKARYHLE